MAAELSDDADLEVNVVKGGLLELSVYIDGRMALDTNRLLYPRPSTIVRRTRELLAEQAR